MPRIFEHLRKQKPGAGGEIQLTDAIQALLAHEQVLAYRYKGKRFDCGSKLGYLKATVEFALRHPEVAEPFKAYLRAFLASRSPAPVTNEVPLDAAPELIG
jgi:UTP--glucose-1-phosphate uridylyltransferase